MTIDPTTGSAPAGLQIRTRYWAMSFMLALVKPRLELDGAAPIAQPWGDGFLWVAPGQHTVRASFHWLFVTRAGDATVTVLVPPGHVLHLDYEAPRWFVFLPGRWTVGVTQPLALDPTSAGPRPEVAAGWFADPGGRHDHRYWDGSRWTEHVSDHGVAGVDPPDP